MALRHAENLSSPTSLNRISSTSAEKDHLRRQWRRGFRQHVATREPLPTYHLVKAVRAEPANGLLLGADFTWQGAAYRWPANPFTGRPMTLGTEPRDFTLEPIGRERRVGVGMRSGRAQVTGRLPAAGWQADALTLTVSASAAPVE